MADPLQVIALNVEPGAARPVFYAEPTADDGKEDTPGPPPAGLRARVEHWFHRVKYRWHQSNGRAARLSGNLWVWLHRRTHPDEPLLARLRSARGIEVHYPASLTLAEAKTSWAAFLAESRRRHWPLFVLDLLIAPVTLLLAPLPGPNLIGYWFAYRAVHQGLILIGLEQARSGGIETRFIPNELLDRPTGGAGDPAHETTHLAALGCDPHTVHEFLRRHAARTPRRPAVAPAGGG